MTAAEFGDGFGDGIGVAVAYMMFGLEDVSALTGFFNGSGLFASALTSGLPSDLTTDLDSALPSGFLASEPSLFGYLIAST